MDGRLFFGTLVMLLLLLVLSAAVLPLCFVRFQVSCASFFLRLVAGGADTCTRSLFL